nr:immunoglobulin heavy chain junction region [Mus musculus]
CARIVGDYYSNYDYAMDYW